MAIFMICKVSRRLFNENIGTPDGRKAVAFAIYIKNQKPTSVVNNWSYRLLSRITGLSIITCQKRIATLRSLHLVRFEQNRLVFKKLRRSKIKNRNGLVGYHTPKNKDIDISKFSGRDISVKDIERGLEAMVIVEIQQQKGFVKQLIRASQESEDLKSLKRAKEECRKRGYEKFKDSGISYKYIAKKLRCGYSKVSEVITFGERQNLFKKIKTTVKRYFAGQGLGEYAYSLVPGYYHFYSSDWLFFQPCNRFTL